MAEKQKTGEDEVSVEESYIELRKKYPDLPEFNDINNEFEIATIEKPDFLLREIIRKITEKLDGFSTLIEELMQGDTKMSNIYEWKTMDDEMKKNVLEIYKNIMKKIRSALELSLDHSEEKEAAFVKELFDNWAALKPKLKKFVSGLKETWKKDIDITEKLEYMG